jgi:hypothetical protein
MTLFGPLLSRNSTLKKVSKMRLSAVRLAGQPESSKCGITAKCILPFVLLAVRNVKFLLPQEVTNQSIAIPVSKSSVKLLKTG